MRIAVFADTHGHYPSGLPARLRHADEIWHLGDVVAPELLVEFEQLGRPLRVVRGNCDDHPWPLTLTLERAGVVCHLVHIPPPLAPPGAQIVLHGHTHVPRDETDSNGVRWLNPGSVSSPRSRSAACFAWLELDAGRAVRWKLVRV
ncbi:MAG: metallophosphoesterase family protein [Opitutae bacterium]|nr:metallophosphoesterase family protein [Opitutae bacterium]